MARVRDLLAVQQTVSFEFFPPKTPNGSARLVSTLDEIQTTQSDFVSITYGAAGSERDKTYDIVAEIERDRPMPAMAHLTCFGHTTAEIDELCDRYAAAGVENVLALRGDPPQTGPPVEGDFRFAEELVEYLRADGRFSIGVAAHPEGHPDSSDLVADRRRLASKLLKADFAVTQFFFEPEAYLSLVDDLSGFGCDHPVVPGVIPITSASQVARFAALAGASLPTWLTDRVDSVADQPDEVAKIGIEVATELSQRLLDEGAPGIHLYTLNQSGPSMTVVDQLSIQGRD